MSELIIYVLAGCFLGVFTGLCPGIHVNTLSFVAVSFAFAQRFELALAIVAMAVVHSIVDFVPSILLGAPDSESFLAVLPGHKMLLEGKAMKAVQLSAAGALFGGIGAIAFAPLLSELALQSFQLLPVFIPFFLATVLVFMVLDEPGTVQKKRAFLVAALSSVLGIVVLGNASMDNALFPLVTGFFGASTLLHSVNSRNLLRAQVEEAPGMGRKALFGGTFLGLAASAIVSIIPSVGPAQAAFLLKHFIGNIRREKYLVLLGAVGTANMVFAYYVLYATGKARTGTAAALKQLFAGAQPDVLYITGVVLFALGFGYIASLLSAKKMLSIISRIDYRKLNLLTLSFLCILVFAFTGFYGLIVFATASSIGFYAIARGVKRINTMAFLMVPTILIYLRGF